MIGVIIFIVYLVAVGWFVAKMWDKLFSDKKRK